MHVAEIFRDANRFSEYQKLLQCLCEQAPLSDFQKVLFSSRNIQDMVSEDIYHCKEGISHEMIDSSLLRLLLHSILLSVVIHRLVKGSALQHWF